MKISALIPTYNRRKFVPRAIESILAQTVPVDEIIVVDDGSTDGTAEEIGSRFGERVRVIRQENQGVSAARRRGVLEANGEWIAFLDSDDEWTTDRNRIMREAIGNIPVEVAWIMGDTQYVTDAGGGKTSYEMHRLSFSGPLHVFQDAISAMYPWNFVTLQASVVRREALLAVKCFSEGLKHSEDRLLGIQIACRYGVAAVPDVVTRLYRTSDLSASSLEQSRLSRANVNLEMELHRAHMEGFSLLIRQGRRGPWKGLYAEAVRGLCKVRAESGHGVRRMSLQQFRFGLSCKSILFSSAVMLGEPGLRLWRAAAAARHRADPIGKVQRSLSVNE